MVTPPSVNETVPKLSNVPDDTATVAVKVTVPPLVVEGLSDDTTDVVVPAVVTLCE